MKETACLDLDLRFAKSENGYPAGTLQAAQTAPGAFHLPFQDIEIGPRHVGVRKVDSPANRAAREFGSRLFERIEVYLEKKE